EDEAVPVAECQVARRVLVDQRRAECGSELSDAPFLVDERHLAAPGSALDATDEPARDVRTDVRVDVNRTAGFEANTKPLDRRPARQQQRLRRRDDTFGALRIGRRED